MARKRNPERGESLLILLGVGVAGYFAYINNWLASIGLPYSTSTTVTPPAAGTTAAALQSSPTSSGASSTAAAVAGAQPLGQPVNSAAAAQLQVAANYPYILVQGSLQSTTPPSGYQLLNTSSGNIWARNDVYAAVTSNQMALQAQQQAACTAFAMTAPPGTPCPAPTVPALTIATVQSIMSSSGLSGLGFTRGRSLFPSNPIMQGSEIVNAPNRYLM